MGRDDGGEDDLEALLLAARRALFVHPVAAQSLFRWFVTEGRRYAGTAEGARWQQQLRGSELVHRSRVLWDTLTLDTLDDDPDTVVPSGLLEMFFALARQGSVEERFGAVMAGWFSEEPDEPSSSGR